MPDKIYNDTITIESVETKNNKLTLVAHNKKRYSFWMTKKDGTDSAPYAQYKSMELKPGDSVFIGYVIEEYDTDYGRKQSNKIINFRETNEKPTQTSSQRTESNRGQKQGSSDEFGKRLAIHGFVNALLSNGATVETVIKDLPALMRLEDTIDKYLAGGWAKAQAIYGDKEELPTIQTDDEPPVDSFQEPPLSDSELEDVPY